MMPNLDPRAMKGLMAKMGIKSEEIDAARVVIETPDGSIVVEEPQVTKIEMQGSVSFQISGKVTEIAKKVETSISESDVDFVAERTGISDRERIREALEKSEGDLAKAIIDLTGDPSA